MFGKNASKSMNEKWKVAKGKKNWYNGADYTWQKSRTPRNPDNSHKKQYVTGDDVCIDAVK